MPAAFSLAVFNAPAALATMAFGLKGGYSALYPGGNSISSGLLAAKAALLSGEEKELIVVYADEDVPPEYSGLMPECPPPLAFSFILSKEPKDGSVSLSSLNQRVDSPADFLRSLLLSKEIYVSS